MPTSPFSANEVKVRVSFRVIGIAMFKVFQPGYTCRITVNFVTLKDDSLWISWLSSNIFTVTKTSSKMVDHFLSKSLKFCILRTIRFCSKFTRMWSKCLTNNVWTDFILATSGSAMVIKHARSENNFCSKFGVKVPRLCYICWCWHSIGNLKFLHTFLWTKLR